MTASQSEQLNQYKGSPPRPWVTVRLIAADGTAEDLDLIADTGNPFALVVGASCMARNTLGDAPDIQTNFGPLIGGWVHVSIPILGLDQDIVAYANDAVAQASQSSNFDLFGLAGLPFLRLFEYGGNDSQFWLRSRAAQTSASADDKAAP